MPRKGNELAASVRRRVVVLGAATLLVATMVVAFAYPAQAQEELTGTCGFSGSDVFCSVEDYSLGCSTPPAEGGTVTCENLNDPEQLFSCVLTPNGQGGFAATCTALFEEPPSLPTAKEQCKNGGYEEFGFKNQGQCVAFVERGPKGGEVVPS